MKKIFVLIIVLSALSIVSACETTKGLGRDIQYAGQKMEEAAR